MTDVRLVINGTGYGGWKSVRIERGLTQLAASFELTVTEKWPNQVHARKIKDGDACQIFIDGELELTGYVDDLIVDYNDAQHEITVIGRDRTADIIDSSAFVAEYKNRTLYQIAKALCAPHGLTVLSEVDVGAPFKTFAIEPGMSVFEVIEKAARHRAVLLISDTQGNVIFTRSGIDSAAATIKLGENVKSCQALFSRRERFNQYTVRAQQSGDDNLFGTAASGPEAKASDDQVRNNRALLVIAEAADSNLKQRAQWEASVRYGRGRLLQYTVQGWRGQNGRMWQPNTIVEVDDSFVGVRDKWLVANVVRSLSDDEGYTTDLQVMPKEAFDLVPLPEDDDAQSLFN